MYSFRVSEHADGVFLKCSRFNHACHPYATSTYQYDVETDELRVTTIQDIKRGDEITISYTRDSDSLYDNYGFNCTCPGCLRPCEVGNGDYEEVENDEEEEDYIIFEDGAFYITF